MASGNVGKGIELLGSAWVVVQWVVFGLSLIRVALKYYRHFKNWRYNQETQSGVGLPTL